jgi:hypothetical protein
MPLALRPLRHPPRQSICPLPAPSAARRRARRTLAACRSAKRPLWCATGSTRPPKRRSRTMTAEHRRRPHHRPGLCAPRQSQKYQARCGATSTTGPGLRRGRLPRRRAWPRPQRRHRGIAPRPSRYLHFIAGCAVQVTEWPARAAPPPMPASCPARNLPPPRISCARSWRGTKRNSAGLRDRALLLVGFAGALRCAELRPLYR